VITLPTAVILIVVALAVALVWKIGGLDYLRQLLAMLPAKVATPAAAGVAAAPVHAPAQFTTSLVTPSLEAILTSATAAQIAKLVSVAKLDEARTIRRASDEIEAMEAKNLELKATIHQALGSVFKLTDTVTAPVAKPVVSAPAPAASPTA